MNTTGASAQLPKSGGPDLSTGARGLATLAMLKVNFDAGRDHIDMFLPFVLDVVASHPREDFLAEEIRDGVMSRHGLHIPLEPIRTMLSRVVKRGLARREAGRYFKLPSSTPPNDLRVQRAAVESANMRLASDLSDFAARRGVHFSSPDDALSAMIAFLDQHHVAIVVDDSRLSAPDQLARVSPQVRVVAEFLKDTFAAAGSTAETVRRLVEGYVLQNVLLLRDIGTFEQRFDKFRVFLDTSFLLRALGFEGSAEKAAARDGIELMRNSGIRVSVFEDTVFEIKTILKVYEHKLGTVTGIQQLRPGPVTRWFLANKYTPSDVREAISLLEKDIRSLGLSIESFPKHDVRYTLDENALVGVLLAPGSTDPDHRVWHDVNCTAAVLTLRGGRHSALIEEAIAVFATMTGLLVDNVRSWYRSQDEGGVSPVIHVQALLNIVWLKRPSAGARLKVQQLIALCEAALRPSRETWNLFMGEIRRKQSEGRLTSDEAVALVASGLMEAQLAELEYETDVDATTVSQVIDRVKGQEEERLRAALESERSRGEEAVRVAEDSGKSAVAEREAQVRERDEQLRKAKAAIGAQRERIRHLELRNAAWRGAWARWIANSAFGAAVVVVGGAIVLLLPEAFGITSGWMRIAGWIAVGLFAGVTFLSVTFGLVLARWRDDLRRRIARVLRRLFGTR